MKREETGQVLPELRWTALSLRSTQSDQKEDLKEDKAGGWGWLKWSSSDCGGTPALPEQSQEKKEEGESEGEASQEAGAAHGAHSVAPEGLGLALGAPLIQAKGGSLVAPELLLSCADLSGILQAPAALIEGEGVGHRKGGRQEALLLQGIIRVLDLLELKPQHLLAIFSLQASGGCGRGPRA